MNHFVADETVSLCAPNSGRYAQTFLLGPINIYDIAKVL